MTRRFWFDLLERAARTFVQGFAAALAGSELSGDWSVWTSAGVAGVAAAASAIMAVLTAPVGSTTTASLIPDATATAPAGRPVVVEEPPSHVGQPVRVPDMG